MPVLKSAHVSLASSSEFENQDTVFADEQLGLFIVCDGMGGTRGGKAASNNAVEAVVEHIKSASPQIKAARSSEKPELLSKTAREAAEAACQRILRLSEENPDLSGMGTTLTMVIIDEKDACLAHVGDSRLYLKRKGKVHQLTKDHTLVGELIRGGEISPKDAVTHPLANVLTRSIGKGESVLVDCLTFEVIPNDTLVLCSDGLWASFPEPNDFLKPFRGNSPKEKSQNIATYCVENRLKKDDVSIVLVDVKADESKVLMREEALGELVSLKIETLQQVYLFSELSMSEIYKLLAISKLLEFQAGDLIIEQGERSASLFIILEGEVQILRNQKEISRFNKGQHFGEMAFFSNEARTASAKSLSDSRLIQIEQEAFASLIRRDSHIAISSLWKLASELSSRLQVSNEHLDFCAPKK